MKIWSLRNDFCAGTTPARTTAMGRVEKIFLQRTFGDLNFRDAATFRHKSQETLALRNFRFPETWQRRSDGPNVADRWGRRNKNTYPYNEPKYYPSRFFSCSFVLFLLYHQALQGAPPRGRQLYFTFQVLQTLCSKRQKHPLSPQDLQPRRGHPVKPRLILKVIFPA